MGTGERTSSRQCRSDSEAASGVPISALPRRNRARKVRERRNEGRSDRRRSVPEVGTLCGLAAMASNFAAAVMHGPIGRRQYRDHLAPHQMQIATWERIPSRTQVRVGVSKELGPCRRLLDAYALMNENHVRHPVLLSPP
jgi:hypothetical protein